MTVLQERPMTKSAIFLQPWFHRLATDPTFLSTSQQSFPQIHYLQHDYESSDGQPERSSRYKVGHPPRRYRFHPWESQTGIAIADEVFLNLAQERGFTVSLESGYAG